MTYTEFVRKLLFKKNLAGISSFDLTLPWLDFKKEAFGYKLIEKYQFTIIMAKNNINLRPKIARNVLFIGWFIAEYVIFQVSHSAIRCRYFISIPPLVFWRFRGYRTGTFMWNELNWKALLLYCHYSKFRYSNILWHRIYSQYILLSSSVHMIRENPK